MTAYIILDAAGTMVSAGTVIADPLPSGHTKQPITDADYAALRDGTMTWEGAVLVTTDRAQEESNAATLRDQLRAALVANRTFRNATKPATAAAQASAAYDQVVRLSGQNNALIRLTLGMLDATD